ncbi:uncharacterized protein LOC129572528 [Sitodiplosis mosellana]|uniref:uncharacterized protein LOC129572528 n=1 Tax=Sitodiplosis mosellana TaxID=263140 RepID=UPI002443A23C|nr:uncharacterized protein LOC129572528 [Sitodiplosis mosellana]
MNSKLSTGQKCHNRSDHNDKSTQKKRSKLLKETKITDINCDCLEKIFEYLAIGDLLNVDDSNKWLKLAAAIVFGRKFGHKNVKITDIYPKYGALSERDGTIVVGGLKTCLQFLRCFGESVKKLDVSFVDSTKKHHSHVDEYINDYCADSLGQLRVYGRLTSLMKDISKPFSAVESLCFEECVLGSKLTQFNVWFPRLRHLVLFTNCLNPTSIQVSFPYLEHLATEINHGRSTDIGTENLKMALGGNPQLRSLYIRVDTAEKFVFDDFIEVICQNPFIDNLQTHWYYTHTFHNSDVLCRIAKALPSLTELHFTGLVFKNVEIARFLDQHKSLKKFSFVLSMGYAYKFLQSVLGNIWNVSRDRNNLITLQR